MNQRRFGTFASAMLALLLFGGGSVEARYDYGRYRGSEEQGFFVALDLITANPRNTDAVVATGAGAGSFPIIPVWDDEPTGRVGVGYRWAGGTSLRASFWGFNAETVTTGSEPVYMAIGPPVPGVGDSAASFDITTEVTARTADLTWGRAHELNDSFALEWSAGLRYASFEETQEGIYGGVGAGAGGTYDARKSNEAEMIGVRAAVRGTHRFSERFSLNGGLGFSMMDGENEGRSSLTRSGLDVPASASMIKDDSRSGTIRDIEIAVTWHGGGDRYRISLGWEQSAWEQIPVDLVRDFPGTSAPLRDRDTIIFSGYKLGFFYRF